MRFVRLLSGRAVRHVFGRRFPLAFLAHEEDCPIEGRLERQPQTIRERLDRFHFRGYDDDLRQPAAFKRDRKCRQKMSDC